MRRRTRIALPVVVLVAALCAASISASASVGDANGVPVKQWVGSVCTDFSQWEGRLGQLGATSAPNDPTAGKAAITTFLTGALKATDKLAKQLRTAGVPKIEDGKVVASTLASSVKSLRAAYAKAKTDAAALPTADPAAFSLSAQAIVVQLTAGRAALTSTLAEAGAQHPASGLDEAFASAKACRPIA